MREFDQIDNPGDGNCFFYAVVIGMYHILETAGGNRNTGEAAAQITKPLSKRELQKLSKNLRNQVVDAMSARASTNRNFKGCVVAAEINYRVARRSNPRANVSILLNSYMKRMRTNKIWGGNPESEMSNRILKSMGFKGLEVYEQNARSGRLKKIENMTSPINSNKELPSVKILLHLGESGLGVHYTTLVPKP